MVSLKNLFLGNVFIRSRENWETLFVNICDIQENNAIAWYERIDIEGELRLVKCTMFDKATIPLGSSDIDGPSS